MDSLNVELADFNNPEQRDRLRSIRRQVFIVEQNVPEELEWDNKDQGCTHILAFSDGKAIGTGRLTKDGKIGRMAVLGSWRGQGVGGALLSRLVELARLAGLRQCELNAQVHAIGFYERYGFTPEGAEFDDAGIPHRRMFLNFGTATDAGNALASLVEQGSRELALWHDNLDPRICTGSRLERAVTTLALRSHRARVQILYREMEGIAPVEHGLFRVAQKVPSRIQIRRTAEEGPSPPEAFAVTDNEGYWHQAKLDSYRITCDRQDGRAARRLRHLFNSLWDKSCPDPETRQLRL